MLLTVSTNLVAHVAEHSHTEEPAISTPDTSPTDTGTSEQEIIQLEYFPTYHPLVVHFPIVLLITGAVLHILNLFFKSKSIDYVTLGLIAVGAITAWISGNIFHPHLSPDAPILVKETLEKHEQMAYWTIILSFAATLFKVLELRFPRIKWITAILAIAASITVSITGHHGAVLTHQMGVGAKGKYLQLTH